MKMLTMLNDYINPTLTMEEYCTKYKKHLKFDPVEYSQKWEEVIYLVEKECDEVLNDEPRGIDFCFLHRTIMGKVLDKYGISRRTPSEMNSTVLFD